MRWVLEMPARLRIFAGVAEGLAGVGLVIPPLVHVLTWLTPLAAAGLVVLMLGAIVFHVRRREYPARANKTCRTHSAMFIDYLPTRGTVRR